ncbi:MAG: S-layer homology domain-containing protein [Ruminococcaceae bacterium]|nr:S-layer homology domain-containing protein [Oscillospiraceae bacterium]
MKRFLSLFLALTLCFLLVGQAFMTGGTADDPVISLSYLNNTLKQSLLEDAEKYLAQTQAAQLSYLYESYATQASATNLTAAIKNTSSQHVQARLLLKSGDTLTLAPGAQVTLLAGAALSNSDNLVDITDGKKHDAYALLTHNHCYMKNDQVEGGVLITSETAEVFLNGVYSLAYSNATDYASLADALYEMGLFSGSSGAVTGYALENSCTRIQAVAMFLRLIGVSEEAQAYQGSHPFTDVPKGHWAYNQLAYAYANGLAYGTSTTTFSPDKAVTAQDYLTFLMRTLHYKEGTEFSYRTVLSDVIKLGVFSQSEITAINTGLFLRNKMVYLSYYLLFATEQQSGLSLVLQLVRQGNVSLDAAIAGAGKAIGGRIY